MSRRGATFTELLIVIGIIAVLAGAGLLSLFNRRGTNDFTNTGAEIAALLREAQSRSVSQAGDSAWGVHFENSSNPFYTIFSGTYSTSTRIRFEELPDTVAYVTSSVPDGGFIEITFSQLRGQRTGSSSVSIYLLSNPLTSSTISVSTSGAVSF